MPIITIRNRWNDKVIISGEYADIRAAAEAAVREGVSLRDADMTDADMTDANMTGADMTGADMTRADMTRADMTDANMTDADMTGADMTGANMTRADMTGADMTGAAHKIWRTIRGDLYLVLTHALAEVPGSIHQHGQLGAYRLRALGVGSGQETDAARTSGGLHHPSS